MARVTGIGGVFLRARDPKALSAWYAKHLNLTVSAYGGVKFLWSDDVPVGTGLTTWSTFPEDTDYFGPNPRQTMINYRVDDLRGLVAQLTAAGIKVEPYHGDETYGKFAWVTDPEGNRLELWQPVAKPA